jgi:hypothetical protein
MEVRLPDPSSIRATDCVGGFSIGQAYDTLYTPDGLVKDSVESVTPVIYVALNYRIGSKFTILTSILL